MRHTRSRRSVAAPVLFVCVFMSAACCVGIYKQRLHVNVDLAIAIKKNDLTQVRRLLEQGADPNTPDMSQNPPSLRAMLLDFTSRLTGKPAPHSYAPTALLVALWAWWKPEGGTDEPADNTAIVKLLLNAGAGVNARDKEEDTPLILAALSNRPEIVQLLIDRGAELNVKDNYGFSAFDYVSGRHQHPHYVQVMQVLKRAGAREE